jgi:hypothetical protein
MGKMLLYDAMG